MSRFPQAVVTLLADIERYAPPDTHIGRVEADASGSGGFAFYTATNEYRIKYRTPTPGITDGYLGCDAVSRTPRAGEDWRRGNDLHDGPFTLDTWRRILANIVSYEMVRVSKVAQEP